MTIQPSSLCNWSGSLLCSIGLYLAQQEQKVLGLINFRGVVEPNRIIEQIQIDILRSLASSLNLPLFTPYSSTNSLEIDLKALLTLVNKKYGVHSMVLNVFGEDHTMNELRQKYEECDIDIHNFVEDYSPIELYKKAMNLGFKAHILSVNEKSLNRSYIGAPLTLETLEMFEDKNIHPFGINGEFETICTGGPNFQENLSLQFGDVHSKQDLWFREVYAPI